MYARLENENIITYRRLPVQFEDENGLHLNFRNVADPSAYGFYNVVTPSYDSISQRLGAIEFDSDNDVFTYSVSDIDYTTTYDVLDEEGEPTGETLPNYDIDVKKLSKKINTNKFKFEITEASRQCSIDQITKLRITYRAVFRKF